MKELCGFADLYQQLPEEPLMQWIARVTTMEVVASGLNAAERKSVLGLMQGPQFTME